MTRPPPLGDLKLGQRPRTEGGVAGGRPEIYVAGTRRFAGHRAVGAEGRPERAERLHPLA